MAADLKTIALISQIVEAPVDMLALGVAPVAPVRASSATNSISSSGETFTRPLKPIRAIRLSPKPESA